MSRHLKLCVLIGCLIAAIIFAVPPYLDWRDTHKESAERAIEDSRAKRHSALLEAVPQRLRELPQSRQDAAKAVATILLVEKEVPEEFRAVVEEADDGTLVFHLWHVSAFEVKREAAARGFSVIGNPGGKCRDIVFDTKSGKASSSLFWQ
jgi:hypothetical protein